MNNKFIHSLAINLQKCRGCIHCIRYCPTEAMRVRNGKALILSYRCIDCGECIRICPYHAPFAFTQTLDSISSIENLVVIIPPELYAQFPTKYSLGQIQRAVLKAFSAEEVWDTTFATYFLQQALEQYISSTTNLPLISTYCPAIVELIQVRFPTLVPHLSPFRSSFEVMGEIVKKLWKKKYPDKNINLVYVAPCPAQVTNIKEPCDSRPSNFNHVLGIDNVYLAIKRNIGEESSLISPIYPRGMSWGSLGGESSFLSEEEAISVGGIEEVVKVLEDLERNRFQDIKFLELRACKEGCIGGVLNPENIYLGKKRLLYWSKRVKEDKDFIKEINNLLTISDILLNQAILPRPIWKLDEDMSKALKKMEEMREIVKILPGLDCGSCGSPTCASLAEDIVRGNAQIYDCIFILKEKLREMAKEMEEIAQRSVSIIPQRKEEKDEE
ncbi:MAG: [Fe-Fe] hydrogenase large subunit C-terminal domain-containing protein [Dictyoglomaceae bacterium]